MRLTIEVQLIIRWFDQRVTFKNLKQASDLNNVNVSTFYLIYFLSENLHN